MAVLRFIPISIKGKVAEVCNVSLLCGAPYNQSVSMQFCNVPYVDQDFCQAFFEVFADQLKNSAGQLDVTLQNVYKVTYKRSSTAIEFECEDSAKLYANAYKALYDTANSYLFEHDLFTASSCTDYACIVKKKEFSNNYFILKLRCYFLNTEEGSYAVWSCLSQRRFLSLSSSALPLQEIKNNLTFFDKLYNKLKNKNYFVDNQRFIESKIANVLAAQQMSTIADMTFDQEFLPTFSEKPELIAFLEPINSSYSVDDVYEELNAALDTAFIDFKE